MENENFNLTQKALGDLRLGLENLQKNFAVKKNACIQQKQSYKHNLSEKNNEIENLKNTVRSVSEKIGTTLDKIDMVLKENGSGNNSN